MRIPEDIRSSLIGGTYAHENSCNIIGGNCCREAEAAREWLYENTENE